MQEETIGKGLTFSDFLRTEEERAPNDISTQLVSFLSARKLTVSVIESVTGGGISHELVQVPGCSDVFFGGVIAYHSRLKISHGLVAPKTMAEHGVVSAMVTQEMAAGIKQVTKSDISIASNGFAGPTNGAFSSDQTGTVFLSWNIRDKIKKTKRYKIEGGRQDVIKTSVYIALSMCLRYLKNELRKED